MRPSFSEVANECSDKDPYLTRRVNPPFRVKKDTFQAITDALSLPMMSHMQMYVDGATMFMDMGTSLSSSGNEVQCTRSPIVGITRKSKANT